MYFHFCGNIIHDIVHNTLVVLALMPEAVPLLGQLRAFAVSKYEALHAKESHCCGHED